MKKLSITSTIAITIIFLTTSCQKPCITCNEQTPSILTLSLASDQTKATTSSENSDNTINTADVFIFRNTAPSSADYQKLETHKRFSGNELDDLTVTTTTGPKTICVIVNGHMESFNGVTDLTTFRNLYTNLSNELIGSFTMYGQIEETLGTSSSISLTVKRHISRITVTSIKTEFGGTPYEGMTLSNIKLYLVNAHAQKIIYNNAQSPSTPLIYNYTKLIGNDSNGTKEPNLIFKPLEGKIDDTGNSTSHHFYCYSNETDNIANCTKMVIQGDLGGITYYYPILINQAGYGHNAECGHYGVKRNATYSYGVTITRPGSLDPNTPLVPGSLDLSINISDWAVIPHFNKEF